MGEFPIEMWVVATSEEVPEEEARLYWHARDSVVDDLRDRNPRFWLGETEVNVPGNRDKRGPVGRVSDLLFLRGTTPQWHLPKLDAKLETDLLEAFAARTTDPPFKRADPAAFGRFLSDNRGRYLFRTEGPLGTWASEPALTSWFSIARRALD